MGVFPEIGLLVSVNSVALACCDAAHAVSVGCSVLLGGLLKLLSFFSGFRQPPAFTHSL